MTKPVQPQTPAKNYLGELDQRSRDIFRLVVENYLTSGDPLGSRNISRIFEEGISPATIRNVMSDLEHLGLIYAPHTSAGRLPTEQGLRFFVDSFLQIGDLSKNDRRLIDAQICAADKTDTYDTILAEASQLLSGLSSSAGLVVTSKQNLRLKHLEFVWLEPGKALVVIVGDNGQVENRIIALPPGVTASSLIEASNFVNAKIAGFTLGEARAELKKLASQIKNELDQLAGKLVEKGLAVWAGSDSGEPGRLIVTGHANLLEDLSAHEDLERVRMLFDELESRDSLVKLIDLAEQGEGVRIFIGSESRLFTQSGSSLVVAPYSNAEHKVIGALGIIGPTRLNYARIVPMVDYTAKLISRLLQR